MAGKSENYDTEIELDVNSQIYPIEEGEKIEVVLAEQLRDGDGVGEEETGYDPTVPLGDRADNFEYVMSGRIFKFSEKQSRAYVLRTSSHPQLLRMRFGRYKETS